ncbi:acetylxylan esterase, partial [bacterium BMS3Abin03]|nr:acetylxylan esterase [bacterium BMS3Abin03]
MKNIYYTSLLILFIICKTFGQIETKELSDSLLSPVTLTAEQDHARLMKLLGIDSLRPGPSGDPKSPDAANTDESIANPYPNLPDPLTLNNGQKVTTAEMWWKQRRPEIKEFFDREIYGRVPENVPKVNWEVVSVTKDTIQ